METLQLHTRFAGLESSWARFDSPAGTQIVDTAVQAMSAFMRSGDMANDAGFFPASQACDELLAATRAKLGRLLGGTADEIVIGPSTTANIFALTAALAQDWHEGDEIVCTELDHDSNVAPWLHAARQRGARVRMATADASTGHLDEAQFEDLVNDRTVWVAITAASNAIGTVPNIAKVIEIAKRHSARVLVDAVAYVPHRRVDVHTWGCDVLVTSPYKWYAPHSGVMWVEKSLLDSLRPVQIRAGHHTGPSGFEYGTTPFEILAGISAAVDFMLETGYDRIAAIEDDLTTRLLNGLNRLEGVNIHGATEAGEGRTSTVGFTVDGLDSDNVAEFLAGQKIALWSGDFYAIDLVKAMNLEATGGFVRAGIAVYNTVDDVDRLLTALAGLRQQQRVL